MAKGIHKLRERRVINLEHSGHPSQNKIELAIGGGLQFSTGGKTLYPSLASPEIITPQLGIEKQASVLSKATCRRGSPGMGSPVSEGLLQNIEGFGKVEQGMPDTVRVWRVEGKKGID